MQKCRCSCKKNQWHNWPCTDPKMHSTEWAPNYGGYIHVECKDDKKWYPMNECTLGKSRQMLLLSLLSSLLGCLKSDLSSGSNIGAPNCYFGCSTAGTNTHASVTAKASFTCSSLFFLETDITTTFYDAVCQADGTWVENGLSCVKSMSIIKLGLAYQLRRMPDIAPEHFRRQQSGASRTEHGQ